MIQRDVNENTKYFLLYLIHTGYDSGYVLSINAKIPSLLHEHQRIFNWICNCPIVLNIITYLGAYALESSF